MTHNPRRRRERPACLPATDALLQLAAETRPDIDLHRLRVLVAEALAGGKPWPVVMVQTARMLAHGDEGLRELRDALIDPHKTHT